MKFKALRYKKEFNPNMEFVRIEDMGAGPEVFTSDTPYLQPETLTYEDLREYMETDEYYEGLDLDWDKVELVGFHLVEVNTVGADIRNKLSPCKNLGELVKVFLDEEHPDKKNGLKELIYEEIKQSKKSVDYLASLL